MIEFEKTHKCYGCKWFQWLTPGVCGHAKIHEDCYEPEEQQTYSFYKEKYKSALSMNRKTVIECNDFETNNVFNTKKL